MAKNASYSFFDRIYYLLLLIILLTAVAIIINKKEQIPPFQGPREYRFHLVEAPVPNDAPNQEYIVGSAYVWHLRYAYREELLRVYHYVGVTDNLHHDIWLTYEDNVYERKRTLLHELMHVALEESRQYHDGVYYGEENSFVEPMSISLYDILHRNPVVTDWMFKDNNEPRADKKSSR